MVQDLTLTPEIVEARLRTLAHLADLLDGLLRSMGDTHKRQTTATWSAVPTCQDFAVAYTRKLGEIWAQVTAARTEVRDAADSLRLGAAALTNIDQDVQDRLRALVNRLNATESPQFDYSGMAPVAAANLGIAAAPVSAPGASLGAWKANA